VTNLISQLDHLAQDLPGLITEIWNGSHRQLHRNTDRDVGIAADRLLHEALNDYLVARFDFPVLSEEAPPPSASQPACVLPSADPYWVLDPLDGTHNYLRRVPLCCVSLGLWRGGAPVWGLIWDPNHNEMFVGGPTDPELGLSGHLALNGVNARVSDTANCNHGVLATGFPAATAFDDESLLSFVGRIQRWRKVRLLGSAALSLAWVACGRLDAYGERAIRIWDVAAGLALVLGGGGNIVVAPATGAPTVMDVFAGNGRIEPADVWCERPSA